MEMVTIIVDGRPVRVPHHTNAGEIRRIARYDESRLIARAAGNVNKIVSGELDVADGDMFVVSRPFTKGYRP